MENFAFDTIESAIEDIRAGKVIIVVDDEDGRTRVIIFAPRNP